MARHGIPTASYRNFTDAKEAIAYLEANQSTRYVIKVGYTTTYLYD